MTRNTLTHDDMQSIVGYMSKDLLRLMKAHPIFLAGGYIRARVAREEVSDIDLFSVSKDACKTFATTLAMERGVKVFETRNAYTVIAQNHYPVQFIHRWTYDNPVTLVDSFDFSVARAAIWFDNATGHWHSHIDPMFYPDVAAKRLTYRSPIRKEDAAGSLLRVLKFAHKGYHISPDSLSAVVVRLMAGVDPNTRLWQEGDEERHKILVGLMRHVDPLTVIEGLRPSDDSFDAPPAEASDTAADMHPLAQEG